MTYPVLIVEDNYFIAVDLAEFLEVHFGYNPTVVQTCAEAENYLSPLLAFALLDMQLPDGTCQPIARRLDALGIPYAFVSSRPQSDLPETLHRAPFIRKPARAERLLEVTREMTKTTTPTVASTGRHY